MALWLIQCSAHINAWQQTCADFELPFERDWFYAMGGSPTINTAVALLKKYDIDADPQLLVTSKLRYFDEIKHKGDIIPATFSSYYSSKRRCINRLLLVLDVIDIML